MNKAEKFVSDLCTESFFNLWSYANPRRPSSHKELCDILVVCKTSIIIISVKEINVQKKGNYEVDAERWFRKAVDESVKQIYGAERQLLSMKNVIRSTGEPGIDLPDLSIREVYRIGVALGSNGKYSLKMGDFGKGYVHIFDEVSFQIIMKELDTIKDFLQYLDAKEKLLKKGIILTVIGEENILALFLRNKRSFNSLFDDLDVAIVEDGHWQEFAKSREYLAKQKADEISHLWDKMIKEIVEYSVRGTLETATTLSECDEVLRIMALENRYCRRLLGKALYDFIKRGTRSRLIQSPSGITYVFLKRPHGTDRDERRRELADRCYVARGLYLNQPIVIGVATEDDPSRGVSFDVCYLEKESLDKKDIEEIVEFQKKTGIFSKLKILGIREDEYPHD
jgi:hypothetical protein